MPDRLETSAEKLGFLIGEFRHFAQVQVDMAIQIKDIHEVLYVKRNGNPPLTQQIEEHEERICAIEDHAKEKKAKRWQVIFAFISAFIIQTMALVFILLKELPHLIK